MRYLRQSTAATIQCGPYLDATDGVTPETGQSPTVQISKAGAAFAARNSADAIAHDTSGWYRVPLDATDTNTLGSLIVDSQSAANWVPVWHEFVVLSSGVYDSMFGTLGWGTTSTTVQIDRNTQEYSADEQTDYVIRAYIVDTDGSTPLNVGDATEITYTVSDTPDSTTAEITKTKTGGGITVGDGNGTNDLCSITITEADTTGLTGRYFHQLLIEDAAGDVQSYIKAYINIDSRYV